MPIPRILHQLWIGDKPMPSKFMDTWKDKHPGFEYIRWTEAEIAARGITFACQKAIDDMSEINGKADIMRWELLYRFGGVFVDADSICIESIDELIEEKGKNAFAGYENEQVRPGLIATGTMGFTPQHPLCRDAIQWILANDVSVERTGHRAWKSVGPGLLTRLYDENKTNYAPGFTIYPSYFFLPIHHTGLLYNGHAKVYAYQEWGSTKQNYEVMNQVDLPPMFLPPEMWVSILICSYNTPRKYIKECLQSIAQQRGHFGMEVVWINDGSSDEFTTELKEEIHTFVNTTRFTRVVYKKIKKSQGTISTCLNRGIALCKHDIVFRMDSDDIMLPDRIQKQLNFFRENPDCVVCGANVGYLHTNVVTGKYEIRGQTNHPTAMTWASFLKEQSAWFMNHPTLCYKKSAVLEVGGYDESPDATEDWMLEVALMKRFGAIHNLDDVLLYYRIHPGQLTFQGKFNTPARMAAKEAFLRRIVGFLR